MYTRKLRGRHPQHFTPTAEFIETARLRSLSVIRREQDKVYNLNWACRDAAINGKKTPKSINPEVVQERHHALNWLVNDDGEDWDDVSTDT